MYRVPWSSPIISYRRTYIPETYHIAQEIQKYNIPDYRPRQEQYVILLTVSSVTWIWSNFAIRFQKAIKTVRAVQRMRRNRGFAFSQTENASRQDQARLIRAYDTSKAGARPTGYWVLIRVAFVFSPFCYLSLCGQCSVRSHDIFFYLHRSFHG